MKHPRKKLRNLHSVKLLEGRPPFIPLNKGLRGSQAAGIQYEKKVAGRLRATFGDMSVMHGPWFEYIDERGNGWCSPDILILPEDNEQLFILECKLTATDAARKKLYAIYRPIVEQCWPARRTKLVQVCNFLRKDFSDPLIKSLDDLYIVDGLDYAVWNLRIK